jgi:hypothetical protein
MVAALHRFSLLVHLHSLLVHLHNALELAGQGLTDYLVEGLLLFDFRLCTRVLLGQVRVFEDVLNESTATN